MIGYPLWANPVAVEEIRRRAGENINNLGNPYKGSRYAINSMREEVDVLEWFGDKTGTGWKGVVTSSSSTSNSLALYIARNLLYASGNKPISYCSSHTHYSVRQCVRRFGDDVCRVDCSCSGKAIDYASKVNLFDPAICVFNAGTTMTGAVDDLDMAREIKRIHPNCYIHIDAALSGMILPFVTDWKIFDVADSVCISGHKMLGVTIPCSVLLFKNFPEPDEVEYLKSDNITIEGSRSGLAVLGLRAAIECDWKSIVNECLEKAAELERRLASIGAWRNEHSITVVFDAPPIELQEKWSLPVHGGISHAICMPHVTEEMIDEFVFDMEESLCTK